MAKKPLNIILLGDPAAGKATQAAFLAKKYKLYDLDMGRELRIIRDTTKNPRLKKIFADTVNRGKLMPTKIFREIWKSLIFKTPKSKGILFDGNPKMIGEAKLFAGWLKQLQRENALVIYLHIPEKEVLKRTSNRVVYFKGKFSSRPDDTVQALRNRVRYYRKNVSEVVKFFSKKYAFVKISGLGTRQQVFKRMEKAIKEFNDKI